MAEELKNPFDPANFVTTSALNGVRASISADPPPEFIKWNYPNAKPEDPDFTVLHFAASSPDLETPREFHIRCGAAEPAVLEGGELKKSIKGNFLLGVVTKSSNLADFFNNLVAAGFDIREMSPAREKGTYALANLDITWKAFEKKFGKGRDAKVYDVPAQVHGRVGEEAVSPEAAASLEEVTTAVKTAIVNALHANKGAIPRGQLSARVGPQLQGLKDSSRALALMLEDAFLAQVPGTSYDGKSIRLVG